MLILILGIAAIIALIISASKTIRFLRQEETKLAKTWAIICGVIVLGFLFIVWIYKKIVGGNQQTLVTGNIGNIKVSNWKEGDYVRVTLLGNTQLSAKSSNSPNAGAIEPWKTKEISGYIKKPTIASDTPELANVKVRAGYDITVIGQKGTGTGNTYFVPLTSILSITKVAVPAEG